MRDRRAPIEGFNFEPFNVAAEAFAKTVRDLLRHYNNMSPPFFGESIAIATDEEVNELYGNVD